MQETQERKVGFLGWEYSLEKEMATCFSILAWICLSMDRGTWPATVHGVEKSQTRLNTHMFMHTHTHTHTQIINVEHLMCLLKSHDFLIQERKAGRRRDGRERGD